MEWEAGEKPEQLNSKFTDRPNIKRDFQPPIVRDQDARIIPFRRRTAPRQWKFLPIPNGPDHKSMGEFPGGPSVNLNVLPPMNVAAFRVTKLEVR
jgi:hypothetical protein